MDWPTRSVLVLVIALSSLAAGAATPDPHGNPLPSAAEYSTTLLPERKGVLSWKTLGQVKPLNEGGRIVPQFSKDVLDLDKQDVRVQGFMVPVEADIKHKHFVLSAVPPSCPFCMSAGPEAIIEVRMKSGIDFSYDPILLSGKFAVRADDPRGVFYILTEAVPKTAGLD
jgi:hypothetical protein